MDQTAIVSLGGQEYELHRARLGNYLQLQVEASRLDDAAKTEDNGKIVFAIFSYLRVFMPDLTMKTLVEASWIEVFAAMAEISNLNSIDVDFAILKTPDVSSGPPAPWEYDKRLRYFWVHLLARAYNWTKEAIENLWPEEALAFIQEIIAHDQYDREFLHSLSEIAYPYNKATKMSRYVPMRRPLWMVIRDPESYKIRMPRELLPVGKIIDEQGEERILDSERNEVLH